MCSRARDGRMLPYPPGAHTIVPLASNTFRRTSEVSTTAKGRTLMKYLTLPPGKKTAMDPNANNGPMSELRGSWDPLWTWCRIRIINQPATAVGLFKLAAVGSLPTSSFTGPPTAKRHRPLVHRESDLFLTKRKRSDCLSDHPKKNFLCLVSLISCPSERRSEGLKYDSGAPQIRVIMEQQQINAKRPGITQLGDRFLATAPAPLKLMPPVVCARITVQLHGAHCMQLQSPHARVAFVAMDASV